MALRLLSLRFALILAGVTVLSLPRSAAAESPSDPAEALVQAAHVRKLASEKTWLRLGHWRRGWTGGFTSEADGDAFFLAKEGKTDPAAELDATLRGFFTSDAPKASGPPSRAPEASGPSVDDHPLCRFPARLMWLQEELGIDLSTLPVRHCPKLEHYWERTRPKSATFIFSSYYLNNPASAFGHTFLRINRDDPYAVGERRELLDYGIDYSAAVDTDNSVVYALKGLTGQFPGFFHIYPYFYKVREYNDYESRDLWEYELDLTPKQVTMLTLHLWELGSTYFAYYYLTENCSYHILGVLEVVDEKRDLLDKVGFPVLPIDTVKAIMRSPGLVRSVHYRPSMRSQLRRRVEHMNASSIDMVARLAQDPNTPFPPELDSQAAKVEVLDAALDLVDFRYAKDILKSTGSLGATIKQRIMERRAEILVPSAEPDDAGPPLNPPDKGHESGRLVIGAGVSSQARGSGYYELGYRLALHDLSDPPSGYPELSQIEFLPFHLRFWPAVKSWRAVELEDAALIEVLSLTGQNRFDRQFSWRVRAGGNRLRDAGCDDCFVGAIEFGAGMAFSSPRDAVSVFLLLNNSLLAGPHLQGIAESPIRFGIGPWGGARIRWMPNLITVVNGGVDYLPVQNLKVTWFAKSSLAWMLGSRAGISLEARAQPRAGEIELSSRAYF
jgi:hypothetical protein